MWLLRCLCCHLTLLIHARAIGDPDIYLGAKLKLMQLENNIWCWGISPFKYVKEAVRNCEEHLKTHFRGKYGLVKSDPNPFVMGYEPAMDISTECDVEEATYFQSVIGIM